MTETEKLKVELELLLNLDYTQAFTGSLDSLRQGSYVRYYDITKMINERRQQLKTLTRTSQ